MGTDLKIIIIFMVSVRVLSHLGMGDNQDHLTIFFLFTCLTWLFYEIREFNLDYYFLCDDNAW